MFVARAQALDRALLSAPKRVQHVAIALTIGTMVAVAIPNVPRQYLDYSTLPVLNRVTQFETYGPDTISEMYQAKVTLNDLGDMYTKHRLDQTPIEAATWSKEASGPYPPAVLLAEAGLYALGELTGVGYYGMILGLAVLFVGLSARYFLSTRWYLFPALYLNFSYFGHRFVYVQDSTYLVMLVVVMAALLAVRHGKPIGHSLMALAIVMKLSPLYYAVNLRGMTRRMAMIFVAIVVAGLLIPIVVWDNYLYIYRFHAGLKGEWTSMVGAMALAVPFALTLRYVEQRRAFDGEDRVGWGLVPFALALGFTMNTARHLLIILLVPDKHGARNLAAAAGLALHALLPGLIRFNALLPIVSGFLVLILVWHLQEIGWDVVRKDLRRPGATLRLMAGRSVVPERR